MKAAERSRVILDRVETEGEVGIADLAEGLGVSEMTIRRDLERLEAAGAVRRVQGRVTKGVSGSYEPPFALRLDRQVAQKAAIAEEVARLIADRETVVLDGGTTGVAVAHALVGRQLTVCTPSLHVADVLREAPDIRLMVTGGFIRRGEESLVGPSALATLAAHRFDTYVMTVSGIDARQGCTEWNVDDASVKRTALDVSTRCLVAADSSKFGSIAFARVCGLADVTTVVSDAGLGSAHREAVVMTGAGLRIAP